MADHGYLALLMPTLGINLVTGFNCFFSGCYKYPHATMCLTNASQFP